MNNDDFEPAPDEEALMRESEPEALPRPTKPRRQKAAPPDRSPPHSAEAEEHVIACCLLDADNGNETLKRCIEQGLSQDAFYFPANRLLYEVCLDLHGRSQPVQIETLAEELKTRRQLEAVGGFPYLMQVTGKIPTTAHAAYFISKVREKHLLRESIKAHTRSVEDAYNFTGDIDEYLQVSQARVEAVARSKCDFTGKARTERLLSRRVRASQPQTEPEPRLTLAGKPIATPGNLVTLISRAKTGKTAALGAATAAIIDATAGTHALGHDTFKFKAAPNKDGQAVIVIDTEQSLYDAYACYLRSLQRAGTDTDPEWLHHYSLVGFSPTELRQALDDAIKAANGKVFAIILDGVADFVLSVNDEAESNAFVTWLRERAVIHDCPVICVIHSNEAEKSGDDGRGHLGKQLIRKAESNLLLKKTGEITTITSDKQRKAPITAQDNVAFRWDAEVQRHISCDALAASGSGNTVRGGRQAKHTIEEFIKTIPEKSTPGLSAAQLHRIAVQVCEIKLSTFKDLLRRAAKDGDIEELYDSTKGFTYRRIV